MVSRSSRGDFATVQVLIEGACVQQTCGSIDGLGLVFSCGNGASVAASPATLSTLLAATELAASCKDSSILEAVPL